MKRNSLVRIALLVFFATPLVLAGCGTSPPRDFTCSMRSRRRMFPVRSPAIPMQSPWRLVPSQSRTTSTGHRL